jgi:hypothetical protein
MTCKKKLKQIYGWDPAKSGGGPPYLVTTTTSRNHQLNLAEVITIELKWEPIGFDPGISPQPML